MCKSHRIYNLSFSLLLFAAIYLLFVGCDKPPKDTTEKLMWRVSVYNGSVHDIFNCDSYEYLYFQAACWVFKKDGIEIKRVFDTGNVQISMERFTQRVSKSKGVN